MTPGRIRRAIAAGGPVDEHASSMSAERRQVARFVVVGVWNTLFAYAVWALLQFLLGDQLHHLVILLLAWPIAVLNAYLCHRHFVFRSNDSVWRELPRFSLVYVATLAGALVALPILIRTLPFNIYVIQAGYVVGVVILSYGAHRLFSFRRPIPPERTAVHDRDVDA
jgi:putative flippase GtrA